MSKVGFSRLNIDSYHENMDLDEAVVSGKENTSFEMESKADIDAYDDVVDTYDEVGQTSPPPVPKRTSCETCTHDTTSIKQALVEIENVCRSNAVVVRRMWLILSATVAVLLTAVATLVLVILMMIRTSGSGAVSAVGEVGEVCGPAGVSDRNTIPDARMTASTFINRMYYPYYGRLNESRGNGAWCAKTQTDRTDYLQVDMGAVHSVCAVATQGETKGSSWTTSYKVQFSTDGVSWSAYKENNNEKVFSGNRDQNTVVKHSLSTDVKARFVRFFPRTDFSWPCMRVEIFVVK